MTRSFFTSLARQPRSSCELARALRWIPIATLFIVAAMFVPAATAGSLFEPPPKANAKDEILLISTRALGTVCNSDRIDRQLQCHRLVRNARNQPSWVSVDWHQACCESAAIPTVVYVHGNRVSSGRDREEGLKVYLSFKKHHHQAGPVRFVIWSWPSSQIPGPIKDYLVKAQRTTPVAWQLAWWIDQLPAESPVSLLGYSYGARVVGGASHLLAGGQLGKLNLSQRKHPARPPVRAALLAAAFDADWLQPGRSYSRSLQQIERMVIATNEKDPAMRFYHLSNGRGRMDALGKSGVHQIRMLGSAANQIRHVDFTRDVGRSHVLEDYLAEGRKMHLLWQQLFQESKLAQHHSSVIFSAEAR